MWTSTSYCVDYNSSVLDLWKTNWVTCTVLSVSHLLSDHWPPPDSSMTWVSPLKPASVSGWFWLMVRVYKFSEYFCKRTTRGDLRAGKSNSPNHALSSGWYQWQVVSGNGSLNRTFFFFNCAQDLLSMLTLEILGFRVTLWLKNTLSGRFAVSLIRKGI